MLIVAILGAAACSSDGDSTSTATSGEEASTTTGSDRGQPSEPVVFEGTFSPQNEILQLPEGFTNSFALEGDLVGQGAFVGEAFPDGEDHMIEGDWAFNLRSPELGEGLIAVQQWDGLFTPTDFNATGEVTGVSGAFAGMVGTTSFTSTGTEGEGTYVFELQPAEPSPEPEATEPLTIDFEAASGPAWVEGEYRAFGGGSTSTGDFVGSVGWTGYIKDGTGTTILINVGTVEGVGDGVFITMMPTPLSAPRRGRCSRSSSASPATLPDSRAPVPPPARPTTRPVPTSQTSPPRSRSRPTSSRASRGSAGLTSTTSRRAR